MSQLLPWNKGTLVALLLLACFIINAGCSKQIQQTDTSSTKFKVLSNEKDISSKILAKISKRLNYFNDLKASAKISIHFPKKKIKRKNIILFRNDPTIRFDVLSLSGRPFIYFIADSKNTSIYYPENNRLFKGAYSPENIARVIGLSLELENITTILSGNFIVPVKSQKIELRENEDYYLMTFFQLNKRTKEVYFNKKNHLPVKQIEYDENEENMLSVQYSDYKKINNYFLPFLITIESPKNNLKILIRYLSVHLNKGISDSLFKLPINKGVKVLPLENISN